ncbi:MAG: hypothetical protein ACI8SA_002587, partial [Dokdonia sp.]
GIFGTATSPLFYGRINSNTRALRIVLKTI